MAIKLTQNQFYGDEIEKPISSIPGTLFIATDTNKMFLYNELGLPILVASQGLQAGNTGAPFSLVAGPAGSSTYSDASGLVYISWVGASGQYNLTLPSAATEPYRVIRFINDGTIVASDKVHLVTPGVETIDGVAEYILNKPYGGVQAWSDGTNWVIMQAKS